MYKETQIYSRANVNTQSYRSWSREKPLETQTFPLYVPLLKAENKRPAQDLIQRQPKTRKISECEIGIHFLKIPIKSAWSDRPKSLFYRTKYVQQGYRYHKLRKTFSKFYRRHYELVSKFNVGLKTLLHQGLSEPEFYGDLVYKFKKIVGRADFSDQFRKIIVRYKRIGYNINIMRQSACLVFNPITVNNFASLFNCTPVGRASDSMMAPT